MRTNRTIKLPNPDQVNIPDSAGCRSFLAECSHRLTFMNLGDLFDEDIARDHYNMGLSVEAFVGSIVARRRAA